VVLMYFREGKAKIWEAPPDGRAGIPLGEVKPSIVVLAVVIICAVVVLALGLFPSLITQTAQRF